MNVIKYKNEEEVPKYNSYALVTKGFKQEKQSYIIYINLYFSQSERSDYLTKQALALESSYYFCLSNIGELRRIYDYYIEIFPQKDVNSKVTLDILKITYRYSKCLYQMRFYCLAKKYASILLSGSGLTEAQANDINKLVKSIDKDFKKVINDKKMKIESLKQSKTTNFQKEKENGKVKYYLVNKEWNEQYNKYLKSEKDEDFPGEIDNHCLLKTTKTVIQYNDNPSHISNYLLKDSNNWTKIDEPTWNKLKEIFNTTCEIEDTGLNQSYTVYKILVLEKDIKTNHIGLLKPLYVKIPKEATIDHFKKIINKWLFKKIKKETEGQDNYTFNIYKIEEDDNNIKKKDLIFDIIFSYSELSNYSCSSDLIVNIKSDESNKNNKVNTLVNENKDILILEIHRSNEPDFLKIYDKSKCSNCNKMNIDNNIKCNKCINSYCNHFYCSENCRDKDMIHINYHNLIQKYIDYDYKLLKVLQNDIPNYTLRGGMHGFMNLGNTCFMNAGLQCITHCEALSTYFLSGEYENDNLNSDNETELAEEYNRFVSDIWNDNSKSPINPSQIRKQFVKLEDEFNNYSQQDSPQMMIDFLNILSAQLNRSKSKQYLDDEDNKKNTSLSSWNTMLNKENSIIKDLFYGLIHNQQKCNNCSYISDKYERFSFFSVPIPSSPITTTIFYKLKTNYLGFNKTSFVEHSFLVNEKMTLKEFRALNSDFNKGLFDVVKLDLKNSKAFLYQEEECIIDNYNFKDINDNYNVFVIEKSKNSVPIFVFYYQQIKENKPKKEESWFFKLLSCCCTTQNENENKNIPFSDQKKEIIQYPFIIKKDKECEEFDLIRHSCKELLKQLLPPLDKDENEFYKNKIYYCITNGNEEIKEIKQETLTREQKSLNLYYQLSEEEDFKSIINLSPKENEIIKQGKEEKREEINLDDCLKFNYHRSNCSLKCEGCKNDTTELYSYISKIPYYLCIQLKRFFIKNHDFVKNSKTIQYEENLNIYDYVDADLKKKFEKEYFDYELFGVNIHSGGVHGGHYYAYCKVRGQWYEFNDSSVSFTNYFSNQAYVLFYKKKQITPTKEIPNPSKKGNVNVTINQSTTTTGNEIFTLQENKPSHKNRKNRRNEDNKGI